MNRLERIGIQSGLRRACDDKANSSKLLKPIDQSIRRRLGKISLSALLPDESGAAYILMGTRKKRLKRFPDAARLSHLDSPIIRYFKSHQNRRPSLYYGDLYYKKTNGINPTALMNQMNLAEARLCVPGYFRRNLMAVMLLGEKMNGMPFDGAELRYLEILAEHLAVTLFNLRMIGSAGKRYLFEAA